MTWQQLAWVAGVPTLLALGLGVALLRTLATARRRAEESATALAGLQAQIDVVRRQLAAPDPAAPPAPGPPLVITQLGDGTPQPHPDPGQHAPQRIDGRLFADLVLRESVVKGAALTHGLRTALSPETRHRIRFEMGREVRRSRKQRRAELREARRHLARVQRAEQDRDLASDRPRGEDAA